MPLFPGESDLDTLNLIMDVLGPNITKKQKLAFITNPLFNGVRLPKITEAKTLKTHLDTMRDDEIDFLQACLELDPHRRQTARELLRHPYFTALPDDIND